MSENPAVLKYSDLRSKYVLLADKMKILLAELLRANGVKFHLVEARAKTVDSFREKIRRPGKSYQDPLQELSDLCGVRLITYYHDDVEKVAAILASEFDVIEREESHQASEYNPEEFGYISLHYVLKISSERISLTEWELYKDMKVEVQIRTVLQHSWAAISHALQYKNEADVPKPLRRKLNRLSGLFELADEQFVEIRVESDAAKAEAIEQLKQGNMEIPVDTNSLQEFLSSWAPLGEIIPYMISLNYSFEEPPYEPDGEDFLDASRYLGIVAEMCDRFKIDSISALEKAIDFDPKPYLKSIAGETEWYVSDDFVLFLLLIRAQIADFSQDDLTAIGWAPEIAERVMSGAKSDAGLS
ncbi:hypothetical protein MOU94_004354 [Vibrio parahaemolyticus]|uniref:GTP pyrophosphokinase n=1 Tax=Vibrio parahaemolyticus TaxID=670 RepID=UPI0023612325|nr:hypothetical protein [Vibrio parahaemolyticus]EII2397809.1 hypothetical protein [Vibrio parahaemolyticus]EIZ1047481.1 hypothetical protein [Vibrio parahaemolyticus]